MPGRPVRRRVLTEVEEAGGWPVILARIASGEGVAEIARSFGVSRSFFSRLLHEDRERHELVREARWRAQADEMLLEAVEIIGFGRPEARRLREVLGERVVPLDRATLATVNRLRVALQGGGDETSPALRVWSEELRELAEENPEGLGELFIASVQAHSPRPSHANRAAVLPEGRQH